ARRGLRPVVVGWVELLRNPSSILDGFRKSSTHPTTPKRKRRSASARRRHSTRRFDPARPQFIVESLFTGAGEAEPTAEPYRCKPGPALTNRSFTAERDHQVSLRKQIAVSTAPAYRKSDDVADVFARAWAFHQSGQFAEARVGYKKVLKKRPNHFAALHLLGASEHQRGDFEAAARLFKRALLLDPRSAQVQ